jgi:hypothetical protein
VIVIPGSIFLGIFILFYVPFWLIRQQFRDARTRREQAEKKAQLELEAAEIRRRGKAEREAGRLWIENWERELHDNLQAAKQRREQKFS